MNVLLFAVTLLIVTLAQSTSIRPLLYNTRYAISHPHYLNYMGPMYQKWPVLPSNNELLTPPKYDPVNIPYEIPREMFRKIFSHNLPSKKFR